jgi:hypothetical protein
MKIRLVRAVITLDLVTDDGEHLRPVEIQPIVVPGSDWPLDLGAVLTKVADELADGAPVETESDDSCANGSEPVTSPPGSR